MAMLNNHMVTSSNHEIWCDVVSYMNYPIINVIHSG
jgi:hypothetical protein